MTQKIVIVDYGAGNLRSAKNAFERAVRENGIDADIAVSAEPDALKNADRIILPGVGAFADCYRGLHAIDGLAQGLKEKVIDEAVPFLGICVGMQLLATTGEEKDAEHGLNWIPGTVAKIIPDRPGLKVPHMGWNTLNLVNDHALLRDIPIGPDGLHAYFVHSYHFVPENNDHLVATTNHGGEITAAIAHNNIFAAQFHPEKSQDLGQILIRNFLNWTI